MADQSETLLKIVLLHKREAEQRFAKLARERLNVQKKISLVKEEISAKETYLSTAKLEGLSPQDFNGFENWRRHQLQIIDNETQKDMALKSQQDEIGRELTSHIVKEGFFQNRIAALRQEKNRENSKIEAENARNIWLQVRE